MADDLTPAADPVLPADDTVPAADPPADADPVEDVKPNPKQDTRIAYEARKAREENEKLRKENEGYKRRDEDARKAKLTDDQRLKEERDALASENALLKAEKLQNKVAAEFKLPAALAARLIGTDEDSLRADAEELAKLVKRTPVGSATDPVRDGQNKPREVTREQLRLDPKLAREASSKLASGEWRLVSG